MADVEQWAKNLAHDLVKAGEAEYGPRTTKKGIEIIKHMVHVQPNFSIEREPDVLTEMLARSAGEMFDEAVRAHGLPQENDDGNQEGDRDHPPHGSDSDERR